MSLGPQPPAVNAHDKHELMTVIGEVSVAWNACQESLFLLFWQLTEMPEYCAQAAFLSLRADAAQRAITHAIAKERYAHEPAGHENPLYKRIDASIGRLGILSGERNAATHTMWEGAMTDKLWPSPWVKRHHGLLDPVDCLAQFRNLALKLLNEHSELNNIFIELVCRPQSFAREARAQMTPHSANKKGDNQT